MITTFPVSDTAPGGERKAVDLDKPLHPATPIVFGLILAAGLGYGFYGLFHDIARVGEPLALGVFGLLAVALFVALGFEFVNGFHDTANAVATVIYTHSLPPAAAVIWSGLWNFTGVVVSSGAVAYTIVNLLPVDLILQVGSAAGYAMIFALLLAAVIWNLATWWVGIPNSSTHCLIGSILGVGLANQLMTPAGHATSGVDWGAAINVFEQLFFSPLMGFVGSAILLLIAKPLLRDKQLWSEPESDKPPPWHIRGLLILTCTGVSFAHGGNDGQKGMGLIMLILIGAAPTAFSVNRTMSDAATPHFLQVAQAGEAALRSHAGGAPPPSVDAARDTVNQALRSKKVDTPQVASAIAVLGGSIDARLKAYGGVRHTPAGAVKNMRNDMYVTSDVLRRLTKDKTKLTAAYGETDAKALGAYHKSMEDGVRYIPLWVKVAVAIALGLGTMVGWKRIVKTVGEKIGKRHLTYGQGAAAELVAAGTILLAEFNGAPVSTTHILSSGVAGTMVANGSGLQWGTVRNIASAWVVTLPVAMTLSGVLYFIFLRVIGAHPV